MRKLLIFGDSFGEESMKHHRLQEQSLKLPSFHKYLRESKVFKEVITYAEGGADLWSQYKLFKQHATGEDYILWFETHPDRLTLPNLAGDKNSHYVNLSTLEDKIYADNPQAKAAYQYLKYLQRIDYNLFTQQQLIKKIKTHPSVFIIPGFPECVSAGYDGTTINLPCLGSIYGRENASWNKKLNEYIDLRRNHMTTPNHIILANQIIDYYTKSRKIDYSKFVSSSEQQFDEYFVKI